jgi:glutamate-5-semialdehyde dehydrogenase
MQSAMEELESKGKAAKAASRRLAHLSSEVKNKALMSIAQSLVAREKEILAANRRDSEEAEASPLPPRPGRGGNGDAYPAQWTSGG